MELQDIIDAWNSKADEHNQWGQLSGDEMVEFTLQHIETKVKSALDDLEIAVYSPKKSGISVLHAIDHVKQIFNS